MTVAPQAALLPLASWLPLGVAIFAGQLLWVAVCLRIPGRRLLLPASALLAADALLVLLARACVSAMGRLDYSESFPLWRWWFLALALILGGLPVPLWAFLLHLARRAPHERDARTPLIRPTLLAALAGWITALAIILATGGDFSFWPRPARITPVEIALPGLPAPLDGLRIAMLADHHIGPLMTPSRARVRMASLPGAQPDLIVALGDLTDQDPRYQAEAAQLLAEHQAPLGTYAVSGNFDVACGTDSLREQLTRLGVTYLENEATRVSVGGADLWLVGVGDAWTDWDDLDRALRDVPDAAPVVLLSHSPDILEEAAASDIPLVLCGHLHGGQVVIPFAGPALGMSKFGTRFASGRWQVGRTHLIVSRGLGEEALPLRLFCPPEIVLVTLRAAPGPAAQDAPSPSHIPARSME